MFKSLGEEHLYFLLLKKETCKKTVIVTSYDGEKLVCHLPLTIDYSFDRSMVRLLLKSHSSVDIADSTKGQTCLMLAASLGDIESMRLLLDYEADPNIQDNCGQTALHHGIYFCISWILFT